MYCRPTNTEIIVFGIYQLCGVNRTKSHCKQSCCHKLILELRMAKIAFAMHLH